MFAHSKNSDWGLKKQRETCKTSLPPCHSGVFHKNSATYIFLKFIIYTNKKIKNPKFQRVFRTSIKPLLDKGQNSKELFLSRYPSASDAGWRRLQSFEDF